MECLQKIRHFRHHQLHQTVFWEQVRMAINIGGMRMEHFSSMKNSRSEFEEDTMKEYIATEFARFR